MYDYIDAQLLADAVRRRPFLWYKDYPERYRGNSGRWSQEWDSVAAELGADKKLVKQRWRSLRESFVRNMKRLPPLQPDQDITEYLKPQYNTKRTFRFCLFLEDTTRSHLTPRQLTGEEEITYENSFQNVVGNKRQQQRPPEQPEQNDNQNSNESSIDDMDLTNIKNEIDIDDLDECEYIDEKEKDEIQLGEEEETQILENAEKNPAIHKNSDSSLMPQQHACTVNKNANNLNDIQIIDSDSSQSSTAKTVKKTTSNPVSFDDDENSLFLRSLLPYFGQLNKIQQLQVRLKIEAVVMKALFERNS